jgi:hypothetical protein
MHKIEKKINKNLTIKLNLDYKHNQNERPIFSIQIHSSGLHKFLFRFGD